MSEGTGDVDDEAMSERIDRFLAGRTFAVVGASRDRSKFGNRVLRHYVARGRKAIPVHPLEKEVEGIACVASLRDLREPVDGVSVIVPPRATLGVLEDAAAMGLTRIWLQPGAEDNAVLAKADELGLELIAGGPCVLVALR